MKKILNQAFEPWFQFNLSFNLLKENPIIFYPLGILGVIQLVLLQVLLLYPQYPFSNFFAPLVRTLWSEKYLNYPYNLILLPKLFYYAQIFVYFLIGNFLLAVTVGIFAAVKNNRTVFIRNIVLEVSSKYVHLCCYSLASLALFGIFNKCYSYIVLGKVAVGGIHFLGSPYVQYLAGVFITTFLAYVIPIIVIEKKKIGRALILNSKMLLTSFWITLAIVLIPNMFYFPVLIIRNNLSIFNKFLFPEIQLIMLVLSILSTLFIDIMITITLTSYYLDHKKTIHG